MKQPEPINRSRPLLARLIRLQFIRFVLVGFVNTGFSYLVYALLLLFGLDYALANLGALSIGILFSFRTQGRFVFNNTEKRLLIRFVITWALIYFLTIYIIGGLITMGFNAYTAGALALPVSALASYLAQKLFVFRADVNNTKQLSSNTLE